MVGDSVILMEAAVEEETVASVVEETIECFRSPSVRIVASVELIMGRPIDAGVIAGLGADVLGLTLGFIDWVGIRAVVISGLRVLTGETIGFLVVGLGRARLLGTSTGRRSTGTVFDTDTDGVGLGRLVVWGLRTASVVTVVKGRAVVGRDRVLS